MEDALPPLAAKRAAVPAFRAAKAQRVVPKFRRGDRKALVRATYPDAKLLMSVLASLEPFDNVFRMDFGPAGSRRAGMRVVQTDASQAASVVIRAPVAAFLHYEVDKLVTLTLDTKELLETAKACSTAQTLTFEYCEDDDRLSVVLDLAEQRHDTRAHVTNDTHYVAQKIGGVAATLVPERARMNHCILIRLPSALLAERAEKASAVSGTEVAFTTTMDRCVNIEVFGETCGKSRSVATIERCDFFAPDGTPFADDEARARAMVKVRSS